MPLVLILFLYSLLAVIRRRMLAWFPSQPTPLHHPSFPTNPKPLVDAPLNSGSDDDYQEMTMVWMLGGYGRLYRC